MEKGEYFIQILDTTKQLGGHLFYWNTSLQAFDGRSENWMDRTRVCPNRPDFDVLNLTPKLIT